VTFGLRVLCWLSWSFAQSWYFRILVIMKGTSKLLFGIFV
jgi:hypothetical protein